MIKLSKTASKKERAQANKFVIEQLEGMIKKIRTGQGIFVGMQLEQTVHRTFQKKKTLFTATGLILSVGVKYAKRMKRAVSNVKRKGK